LKVGVDLKERRGVVAGDEDAALAVAGGTQDVRGGKVGVLVVDLGRLAVEAHAPLEQSAVLGAPGGEGAAVGAEVGFHGEGSGSVVRLGRDRLWDARLAPASIRGRGGPLVNLGAVGGPLVNLVLARFTTVKPQQPKELGPSW